MPIHEQKWQVENARNLLRFQQMYVYYVNTYTQVIQTNKQKTPQNFLEENNVYSDLLFLFHCCMAWMDGRAAAIGQNNTHVNTNIKCGASS